ncbi:MAG: glycine cleavage system protein H [Xanthobacteraceae bacterium]|nr:glycine cleavage system protein H [Xanthobacteraceae bacterium]MBX3534455.1 glycine cleavage system protein H [Xanthobacteraceae bacterium]MBX3547882.1 glycine cleavage system protein H [Xanthobacteraceae bacterium]MCW5677042.1 glycine cleavage system protein H [Xanthobacteraceae bacterium]
MPVVRGCNFPDDLFYDVERHVWYAPAKHGLVRAGMTQVGVALAREVLVFTPKRPGTEFEKGRAFAAVESAKWIGSVRCAFNGVVASVNEDAKRDTALINDDCYGKGWMLLVKPATENWREGLAAGDAVAAVYEAWMESEAWPGCEKA